MSDAPGGPDWYQASDGKWYPPQATPSSPPPAGSYQTPPGVPYQQPPAGPQQSNANGMATASMVLGIIALVTFWLCGLGFLVGVVAVPLGAVGISTAKKLPGQPLIGRAKAGLVMGIVAIVLSVAAFVFLVVLGNISNDSDGINSDPANGVCDQSRFLQDPDC